VTPPGGRFTVGQATVVTVGAQFAGAAAAIAATPYLVRELGVAPYGILLATLVLAGQLTPLHLGVPAATIRLLAACRGRGDARRHAALRGALVRVALAVTVLTAIGFVLIAPWVWRYSFRDSGALLQEAMAALPAAAALVMAQPLVVISQAALIGEERFGAVSAIRIVHSLARTLLTVATVALGGGVAEALWVQAGTDVLIAAAAAFYGGRGLRAALAPGERSSATRELATLGVPFAAVDGLSAVLVDVEKLVLGMVRSAADLTYYLVPFNAALRLTVLTTALSAVLIPRISATAAAGDRAAAGALTHRANRLTAVAMTGVLGLLVAVAPELLTVWVGPDFAREAGFATRVILVALFATTAANAAHAALRAVGRPSLLAALYAAELALHLVVVFVAIRGWGIAGAAFAWGIRAVVDAVAQRVLAARALGTSIGPWREYWVPLVALGGLAAVCELAGPAAGWAARAAGAAALGAATALWLLDADDRRLLARSLRPWRGHAA
jgi:O-antigen/teichoic acid export membrane protein